jgi:hypothetical protein
MTIQITKPEIEALINQRLQSGAFVDAEDVIFRALQASEGNTPAPAPALAKDMVELFANSPFKGLNMDFERDRDTGRDINL